MTEGRVEVFRRYQLGASMMHEFTCGGCPESQMLDIVETEQGLRMRCPLCGWDQDGEQWWS
jgi:formate dehydrogenase maturation protein FdhE